MRWKKIFITAVLFLVVLITAIYVFLAFFDFNTLKPMIARAVKEATGRKLTIAGDIEIDWSIPPTLIVEDVSFQNAPWGSRPNLARVKRIQVQLAVLSLILGDLNFTRIVFVKPDVILELDSAGTSNFAFDAAGEEKKPDAITPPPPLIFSNIQIEKGIFTYRDTRRGFKFTIGIDRLEAAIPGFDKSLSLDFNGALNDIEFSLKGTLGPVWAWVAPGFPLPADFTVEAVGARAHVKGEIRDPYNLKDLALTITAQGPSITGVAKLAGATELPELGAFKVSANVADPEGKLALKGLDIRVGSRELAEISLSGDVKDILARRDINLKFAMHANDAANLTGFGLPPPPIRKAFSLTGRISDSGINIYSVSDLKVVLGEDEISGRLDLNLAEAPPRLAIDLDSDYFILAPLKLGASLTRAADKLALEKLDLLIGTEKLAAIKLAGSIKDLMDLQGVNLDFGVHAEDLAKLEQFTGRPVPLRGAFGAAGKVVMPVHGSLKIPGLQVMVGQNRIDGSVELNLAAKRPRLSVMLSTRKLDLQHVLIPKLAKQDWVKPLAGINPIKLAARLSGFSGDFAVEKLNVQVGENYLTGRIETNLDAPSPLISVELSAPRFNLKSLRLADMDTLANLMQLENLGPFHLKSKIIIMPDHISLGQLDFGIGTVQLAVVEVKGSIKNLTVQKGIDLSFKVHGREIANLEKITGQALPLQGAYAASGRITDPASKTYTLSDLSLTLGKNNIAGRLDMNLAAKSLKLDAQLSAPKFTLQPVTIAALESLAAIEDLGPLKLAVKLTGSGKKFALKNLDINMGSEQLVALKLKGTVTDLAALKGIELDFTARAADLARLEKMGWPELPLKGPFHVSGRFLDPEPKIYKFPSLDVTLGDNDAKGSLELNLTGKRPRVTAQLSSQKIDLRPVLETADSKEAREAGPDRSGEKGDKIFSSKPFDMAGLKLVDADLKIRNKQVLLPRLALDDVAIDLRLEDGNLTVKPLEMKLGDGTGGGWFNLFTRQGDAAIDMDVDFDRLDLGAMFDALGTERLTSGILDGGMELSGRGNSMAELMAGLNGRTYLALGKGHMAKSQLDLISMDLGDAFLQLLNPFQSSEKYIVRNCAVNRIDFHDGLATFVLLLDTEQTKLIAAGDIDLKNETLSIAIKPSPKKGFLQGSAGGLSLNLSELSRPFKLGGTLANPALAIDPGRSILTLGKLAGAVMLGPVGIAAFLADFSGSDENACLKAIESAKKKVEATKKTSTDKKKKDEKKEKKSGGFFNRLFGK